MEVPNKDHALKSIFGESCEKIREAILLQKCDSIIIEDFNHKFKEEEKIQRDIIEEDLEAEKFDTLDSSNTSKLERKLKGLYQDTFSTHQHKKSLFNIVEKDRRTNLLIYNTEIDSQASIILDTPRPLDCFTCITQLPNGKLFCFGNYPPSGNTLLIDENYRVQELPSGIACVGSSAIYFNNNIYCFGGWYDTNSLTLSSRFDLDRNQWNELTPLPNGDSGCNSIIVNGSIFISGYKNKNLLRYSIDDNSFSTIPYDFAEKKRKILINAERLYLIECGIGCSIYESEIENDTGWRKTANNSTIQFIPAQTYCQYNRTEIYIGIISFGKFCCFKFKLDQKKLIKCV